MKRITTLLLTLSCLLGFLSQHVTAQVAPVFDKYVQQGNNGSASSGVIYLRNATGFNRMGYLVFDLCEFTSATTANLTLTISSFNAGLANPQTVNIFALGTNGIPDYTFDTQPANADMDSLGSVELTDLSTELTFDLLTAINNQIALGANYLVIKLVSPTPNAFVQFHSLEAASGTPPFIDTDALSVFPQSASNAGFVQENQTTFNTSLVYLRNASGFSREGYVSFPMTLSQPVTNAKLRLFITNAANNALTDVDVLAYEGDLTVGLDYATQPTSGETVIGTFGISDTATVFQIDITSYLNGVISTGTASALTFRFSGATANTLVQFASNDNADPTLHPSILVAAPCLPTLESREEILCVGDTLFTATDSFYQTGVYFDTLIRSCGSDSIIQYDAFFIEDQTVTIDTSICLGDTLVVSNGVSDVAYTVAGSYTDSTTTGTCTYKVITNLSILPSPEPFLGPDQQIIEGNTLVLDPGAGFSSYLWSTGETSQTITVELGVNADFGDNSFSVTVTNADGCATTDDIVINIQDAALKPTKDAAMREDKNGIFKQGARVELKNDLYGDLSTPRGTGPFFSRQSYFGYDISDFDPIEITSAKFRLYMRRFSPIPVNDDQLETLEIPVSLNFVPELYMDTMTYPNRYTALDYQPIQTNLVVMSADLNTYIEFEITDFFKDEILANNIDEFTLILTVDNDTSSTLINFAASDISIDSQRPRIVWTGTVGIEEPVYNDQALTLMPNPASEILEIVSAIPVAEYQIMDMQGRIVKTGVLNGIEPTRLSLLDLPAGLYILAAKSDGIILTQKFLKE